MAFKSIHKGTLDDYELKRLEAYWWSIKEVGAPVRWRAFSFTAISTELVPRMTVVDVDPATNSTQFRLWSNYRERVTGMDLRRKSPLDLEPSEYGQMMHDQYLAIAKTGMPGRFHHDVFINGRQQSYEVLYLPLAHVGPQAEVIISAETQSLDDWTLKSPRKIENPMGYHQICAGEEAYSPSGMVHAPA